LNGREVIADEREREDGDAITAVFAIRGMMMS
jgi:hypothetical protein